MMSTWEILNWIIYLIINIMANKIKKLYGF